MALRRYEIRNEYGLSDPELYRSADKDDPEALLEGVAMSGLVGLLRQLGDLAEFAAEIFHDLHEEVMSTAARGHGLMTRVQQIEADFPSIEKALLSQTHHSSFFTNSGIDWHPNLRSEQGLITRGDLPRFVMDSYEESRGPPRLFLLDKFDVAGAGACLKRYTDPSFFKIEAAAVGISTLETPREKKIRKVKKKGSRWRNGDTPEVVPTSHPKLHDLFLEERFENGHPDPARLVTLKRRQLHGSPFDARSGKSYMEKFIETPSPENKAVCEVSVNPPHLKLSSDYSSESGLEVHENNIVSPEKNWSPERERNLLSPCSENVVLKPVTNELDLDVIDKGAIIVSDQNGEVGETNESHTALHKIAIEEELAIDVNGKTEVSLDDDHSDGMISEVDNYMDALTTMESEMETDNEYKYRNDKKVFNVGKYGMDFDANEEQQDSQANYSDSQSIGNFSLSDDGNSSYKKQKSISSYSSSLVNSAENALSDGEGGGKVASSDSDLPSHYLTECVESAETECLKLASSNDTDMEERKISDRVDASKSSYPVDSNPILQPSVPVEVGETPFNSVAVGTRSMDAVKTVADLDDSSVAMSNISIQTSNDPQCVVSSESSFVHESDHEDLCMSSDTCAPSILELDLEKRGSNGSVNEKTSFKENVEECVTSQPDSSDVAQNTELISEIHDSISGVVTNVESSTIMKDYSGTDITEEDQSSALQDKISHAELDPIRMKLEEVSGAASVDDCRKTYDAMETAQSDDAAASTVIFSGSEDDFIDDVTYQSLGMPSQSVTDEQQSICGTMDPQQRLLESHEAASPECRIESEASEEVKQEYVSRKDLDPLPALSVSNDHANPEATKQVCDSLLDKHHETDPLVSYSRVESCLEQSQEFKSNSDVKICKNDPSLPSCDVPDTETHLNEQMVQVDKTNVQVDDPSSDEGKCNPLDLQSSTNFDLAKPEILSKQVLDSKYELPDARCLEAGEAHVQPSNSFSEQMPSLRHMDNEVHVDASFPDDVSSQKLTLQSTGLEHHDTLQTSNRFDSAFPGFGVLPEATPVNLEMPPLPPLPPMQWRMAKFQFTQPSEGESVSGGGSSLTQMQPFAYDEKAQFTSENGHGIFPPFQTCKAVDKDQFEFPMSDTKRMLLSNPFLSAKFTDDGRLQALSANSEESSVQPTPVSHEMPAVVINASGQQEIGSLAETQTSNPFLEAMEVPHKKPEDSSFASQSESALSNSIADSSAEDTASGQDHLTHESPIQTLNQSAHEIGSERKLPEHGSECSEKEQGDSPDMRVESVSTVEEEHTHDLAPSKGESTWYPVTSLGLPPTYEAGKQNGNKLPRPRNPLIDAVAAHGKLRKVAERVRPQVGPKVEERDSLLEQIRTKSFNLKPATVTRPSIQGIQGPKTNLKVAAILEKANAIRQALTGSDEDEDSDSWSDS